MRQSGLRSALGRIIAASLLEFTVETFEREATPPLGALVAVAESEAAIYGIVCAIVTEGIDASRPVAPHGGADEDLETVLERNPHLPVLLRTTFLARIAGHDQGGDICHFLPSSPPRLISRVRLCDAPERARFAESLDFLVPLLQSGTLADEVVAAFLRETSVATPDPHAFLINAGRALVPLLINEPERLRALLRRIQPGGHGTRRSR